jgi:DNA-binding NtrC family response regulator
VRRFGDGQQFIIDVRVISGTTAPLPGADLFKHLATDRVRLPALREHLQDLPLLVRHILETLGPRARGFVLSPETLTQLEAHPWPGNVRELHDFIEKALALGDLSSPAATLGDEDEAPAAPATLDYKQAREEALTSFEREYVAHLLRTFDGNVSKASREAGLDRAYLHRLIKRHGLDEK